ncbi:ribonuclease III domain-containing protein [Tissierella sp.]|uniref:Mini-ribonuclease 3 n=1 Tax=Tissierella sp. TaxID=41274 RepID=UPI0028624B30|nr:ribonuclease III domain-containing protein [Tissierella sp.]MDR7857795.1 ribonuclease III domain-containing protein [Tissierella sp.]
MENNNLFRDMNTILSAEDIVMLSPLQLAYIGDAVYELLIRTYLLKKGLSVKDLHRATIKYVKAKSQAYIIHELEDILTEEEQTVVKKGRNAKTNTMPKNADMIDYKYATGLEALFGYLYLTNQDKRISELFEEVSKIKIN